MMAEGVQAVDADRERVAAPGRDFGLTPGVLRVSDRSLSWQDLPEYLALFLNLGEQVAVAHEQGSKSCCVVIPPVRSFGAVFAATGAVIGSARSADSIPDLDAHDEKLRSLPKGTAVVVKMGERIYSAVLNGLTECNGTPCLRIEYDGMTQYLPRAQWHRVQVGSGGKQSLPKGARSRVSPSVAAIEAILGDRATEFLSTPTVDAVLVGQVSLLEQELTSVAVQPSGSETYSTSLAALLRAGRFLPDGGISRSLLLSDRVAEFEMPVDDTPDVAVFDGARALARYRSAFPDSSWIAVLDRCSSTLDEGVAVANEEYAVRGGPARFESPVSLPGGTEFQAFERGR